MVRALVRVFAVLVAATVVGSAVAADHRDGSIQQDQPADIADTFAFVNPNDTSKIVLGVTVNPYTVPGVNASFSTDVLYQIKIDTNGDFVEDLVFQATYSGFDPNQTLTLVGPAKPRKTGAQNKLLATKGKRAAPSFSGPSNGTVQDAGAVVEGMRVFSGRTDDPFFIDLIYVRSLIGVIPPIARAPGVDLFAGLNVSTLMIEVPRTQLLGTGNVIRVWSTASRQKTTARSTKKPARDSGDWMQIDREGLPAINATLIPAAKRDAFNRAVPKGDTAFIPDVAASISGLGLVTGTDATDLAAFLLPDVLTLDTTLTDGFPNGRAPKDDFINTVLSLLTGGAVTTDGLAKNDSTAVGVNPETGFLDTFPFVAPAHAPREPVPARD